MQYSVLPRRPYQHSAVHTYGFYKLTLGSVVDRRAHLWWFRFSSVLSSFVPPGSREQGEEEEEEEEEESLVSTASGSGCVTIQRTRFDTV